MLNQSWNISVVTESQDKSCEQISRIIRILNTTIPLIWVILGTITNGLSLLVFSQKSLRQNSTFFYFALMTLSDFIVIWLGSFRDFLAYKFGIYVTGTLLCRLHVFTFFVCCQFSSWLLTAANLDRFVYVLSYKHSKKWCTKKIALRVTSLILFILIMINIHFLLFVDAKQEKSNKNSSKIEHTIHPIVYPLCQTKPGTYSYFYANYYSWIDSFVFSFVPFVIMLICNLALVAKVFQTKQNLYKYVRNRKESSPEPVLGGELVETAFFKTSTCESKSNTLLLKALANKESIDKMRNMAFTIIGVTLLFIIFTVPINIYVPIMHAAHLNDAPGVRRCDDLIFCILNNMVNANHSTSFFIYLGTNMKFKKEIAQMQHKCRSLLRRNFNVFMLCCGFNVNCGLEESVKKERNRNGTLAGISVRRNESNSNISVNFDPTRHNSVYIAPALSSIYENESSKRQSVSRKDLIVYLDGKNSVDA